MVRKLALISSLGLLLCPALLCAAETSGPGEGKDTARVLPVSPRRDATRAGKQRPPTAEPKDKTPKKEKPARLDVAAEIRKAELYGSTARSDRERLAALYLLDGQVTKARSILAGVLKSAEPKDAQEALELAAKHLRARIAKLPRRGKRVPPTREETEARLRLAMISLALGGPAEAVAVLAPLGPRRRTDRFELQRLALAGLAAWSTGTKDEAEGHLGALLKKAAAGRLLRLRAPALVDRVVCYGVYDERAVSTVRTGESVIAYVEVLNFQCNRMDSGEHLTALDVSLTFEEEVDGKDRRGKEIRVRKVRREVPVLSRIRHRTRSPLRDLHLVVRFNVPPELRAGAENYVKITVRDRGNVPGGRPPDSKDSKAGKDAEEQDPAASAMLRLKVSGSQP